MRRMPRALVPLALLPESEDTSGMGELFRAAHELPEEKLPGLLSRLRASQRGQLRRPGRLVRFAVAFVLVFGLGGVVGAMVHPFRVLAPSQQPAPPAPAPAASPRRPRPVPAPTPLPELSSIAPPEAAKPAPLPEPPPSAVPVEAAKPAPSTPVRRPARPQAQREVPAVACPQGSFAPPPQLGPPVNAVRATPFIAIEQPQVRPQEVAPATSTAPAAPAVPPEQVLLRQAMRALHGEHDARAALALLDEHARRFPAGGLRSEAGVLRTEALLRLGRNDQALALLDAMPLFDLPNRTEHLVVRGELRAAHGRWREALADFDAALLGQPASGGGRSEVQQRALWGRASARSRLGDLQGARVDLDRYLLLYPNGRFARAAAELRGTSP